MPESPQIPFVGVRRCGGEPPRCWPCVGTKILGKDRSNLPGDSFLHRQNLRLIPGVMLAPEGPLIARVYKAHVNSHRRTSALDRTSDDEPHAKVVRYLSN